ncbi:MAG: hypothetical protein Q8P41_32585 [Pseudomonadota bacterium]|nr:hypothetical protein [Pseudomonadota bacterium]
MKLLLLLVTGALAGEPDVAPAAPPAPPIEAARQPPAAEGPPVAGEEIVVQRVLSLKKARAAVELALEAEGYTPARRRGEFTVYTSGGWQPKVLLHDDGWILVGWGRKGKPVERVKADVYSATQDAVRAMNDAVAARSSADRLGVEIPAELHGIWEKAGLSATERHARLFDYWDSRTDTAEGDAARTVVEQFLTAVVQRSDTPLTPAELSTLNARRHSRHALELVE